MTLNQKQREAVDAIYGPLLIIAGAGTGKTHTLISRTKNIIKHGYSPHEILLLTFTNKAANEMKSRIGSESGGITAMTYHSFCLLLLRIYFNYSNHTILDDSASRDTIDIVLSLNDLEGVLSSKDLNSIYDIYLNNDKKISIDDIIYDNFPSLFDKSGIISSIFIKYMDFKKDRNLLSYSDIIETVNQELESNDLMREKISSRYKFKMVDEYQDSNLAQLRFLINITDFGNNNIAVVGDDQQSIYAFRGANFKNIIDFPKIFKGTKTIILEKNYRSNQYILDLSNAVVKSAPEKYEKELKSTRSPGDMPEVIKSNTTRDASVYVVNKIEEYIKEGTDPRNIAVIQRSSRSSVLIEQMLLERGIEYDFYGGLKFTDRVFVRDVMSFLRILVNPEDEISWFRILQLLEGVGAKTAHKTTRGIIECGPEFLLRDNKAKYAKDFKLLYYVYNHLLDKSLYERVNFLISYNEHVEYVMAYTSDKITYFSLTNPNSEYVIKDSLGKVLNVKTDNLGKFAIKGLNSGEYEIDGIKFTIDENKKFVYMDGFYFALIEKAIKSSNMSDRSKLDELNRFENNIMLSKTFFTMIEGFSTTRQFLDAITLEAPESDDDSSKITITTIHSSKGLEFDVVFVIDAVDNILPSSRSEIDEERRCFYVAVSRARNNLYIMVPEGTYMGFKYIPYDMSLFLIESSLIQETYNMRRY